jgi:hypothetical protein
MDRWEGSITKWGDGLVAFECTLKRACVDCDTECAQAGASQQDYLTRIHVFTSSCKLSINFKWKLE